MKLKAFFRVGIYGILMLVTLVCSAQKNASVQKQNTAQNQSAANSQTQKQYQTYLNQAETFKQKGDTAKALENYTSAIKLQPLKADAYEQKGYLLLASRNFTDAVTNLQKAVDMKLENALVFSRLGFAYARVGKNAEAVNYLSKAINLDPKNIENYAHRAYAYIDLEQYERAEQDYKLFLMKNPDDAIAWYNLSRAQYSRKNYEESINSLNKVNNLQPGYLDTYFWLGLSNAGKEDFPNALSWFDKAIIQKPEAGYLYFNRGIAKGRLNRNDFCEDFRKALSLGYTDAERMVTNYCK